MAGSPPPDRRRHRFTRAVFYAHLWAGVILTIALTIVAVTGVLLNHKRGLGLMPDVPHEPTTPFTAALPLATLAEIALRALPHTVHAPDAARHVDRMDVRPRDGIVKVRLRDSASTEVTLDLATGRVLHIGRRGAAARTHDGGRAGMVIGMFVVPAVLVRMGHRLRRRSARWQRAFWGARSGHLAALVAGALTAPAERHRDQSIGTQ